jgi:serine protease Do
MTNEYDSEAFGRTPDPQELNDLKERVSRLNDPISQAPDTQEPAAAADEQPSSIFDKTVFGSAQPYSAPSMQGSYRRDDPAAPANDDVPRTEPIMPAAEEPAAPSEETAIPAQEPVTPAEEPVVYAERVQDYASSSDAYRAQGSVPPYGQTAVPPYAQQSVPPYGSAYGQTTYGQAAQPRSPYYTQQNAYGAPAYAGTQSAPANATAKKSGKGLKVFFTVIALIVLAGVMFGVGSLIGGRRRQSDYAPTANSAENSAAANAPELETKASPASDSSAPAGSVLTPTQIAAKVRSVSVGILVYSKSSRGVASEGSGVLWKEDSTHTYTYIITCAHVVSGNGLSYTVQTEDGTTYDAEVVGADSKTDLAVVRIKAHGLDLAEFGDSSKLQVGDPVYAIGNPGGTEFFGSFTSGIVSAIDRSVKSTYTMVCIQHTAAINPGNSGGALVNQYGQVVGINSQKIIDTQYEGMGFSIPIKSAQSIINSLATYGYVANRPKLGITYAEAVNYQQYSMLIKIKGLPSGSLIITEINEDSSLANTEVQQYDMITKVNGEDMTKPEVLLSKIENGKVGDKLTLTICRIDNNYQTKEFTVTATLVEEKKETPKETTTSNYVDPYDFYNEFFNGLF